MFQGVSAAVDVLQSVNEDASQADEGVGPVGAEFRGLTKRRHGIGQLTLRVGLLASHLQGFTVDAVQVSLAVVESGAKFAVAGVERQRPSQRIARRLSTALP